MIRWLLVLLVSWSPCLLVSVRAQPPARGIGVKVDFAFEPKEVAAGEEFTLTLTVRNAFNPQQLARPDLRKLPEFEKRFQVTDVPGPPPKPTDRDVKFVYKLRPRSDGKVDIPRLAFTFLTPADKPNTTYTQGGLFVTVKPAVVAPAAGVPVEAPEEWFQLAPVADAVQPGPRVPATSAAVWLALLGPVAGLAWYVFWLRFFPDAAALARQRRSRAARTAARAIDRANHAADPAAALAAAVRGYLRDRVGLPDAAMTPAEVCAALECVRPDETTVVSREAQPSAGREPNERIVMEPATPALGCASRLTGDDLGNSHTRVAATIQFLERCDAARFSSATADTSALATNAHSLIAAWEAA